MKRFVSKIICLIVVLSVMATAFVGCDWITTNTDRDMAQVAATVQIPALETEDGRKYEVDAENIYKRQLVSAYVSYAYQYVMYYSYTTAQAYSVALDNLVDNRIIIQQSRLQLANTYNSARANSEGLTEFEEYFKANALAGENDIDPKSGDVENLEKYLTAYEKAQVYYNVKKSINSMIDSYVNGDEEEEAKEDVTYTARTTPTQDEEEDLTEKEMRTKTPTEDEYLIANVTLKYEDLDALKNTYAYVYDLNMAVYEAYEIDLNEESAIARKKGYGSLIKFLKEQGLIGSKEDYTYVKDTEKNPAGADNILNYTYFKDLVKSNIESAIVTKYQDSLIAGVQAKLTDDAVWEQYKEDYTTQKALYVNDLSSYESALGNVSDTSFVLYNPFEGYGYVANLLIGFTDEQKTQLSDFSAKEGVTNAEIKAFRAQLAKQVIAKDQRETWAYLNYGTYAATGYTFDEKYLLTDTAALKNFIGTVTVKDVAGYDEEDDNGVMQHKWTVTDVTATAINMTEFADYLALAGMEMKRFEDGQIGQMADFDNNIEVFNELVYTFSTDPGSLSKIGGYLYSPFTADTSYVAEFAAAAKALVEQGVGAYTAVITDYGIHFMVCTGLVLEPYSIDETGKANFKADIENKDSVAYKYKQVKLNAVTNTEVSKVANKFISEYRENNVTKYENTYSDLITEDEE